MMSTKEYSFNLEACQTQFYTISKTILGLRCQHGHQRTPEEDYLFYYKWDLELVTTRFDHSFLKSRRIALDKMFLLSEINNEMEKKLEQRIATIDALLNRLGNVEITDGYGPHDNLDSVLTVFKGVHRGRILSRAPRVSQEDARSHAAQRTLR